MLCLPGAGLEVALILPRNGAELQPTAVESHPGIP